MFATPFPVRYRRPSIWRLLSLLLPVAVFALVMLALIIAPALAQATSTTVDAGGLFSSFSATLTTIITSLLLLGLGWLGWLLKNKWNIDIDLAHNSIAQTAAQNLASRLVNEAGVLVSGKTFDVRSPAVAELIGDFKSALPGVMARFGLSDDSIGKLILSKLPQLPAATASDTPVPKTSTVDSVPVPPSAVLSK